MVPQNQKLHLSSKGGHQVIRPQLLIFSYHFQTPDPFLYSSGGSPPIIYFPLLFPDSRFLAQIPGIYQFFHIISRLLIAF